VYVAIGLIWMMGALGVWLNVGVTTLLQLATDDSNRGRVASLMMTVGGAGSLLSALTTSALAGTVGTVRMLDVAGLLFLCSGLMALVGRRESRDGQVANRSAEVAG
jgi:hypothetical protein